MQRISGFGAAEKLPATVIRFWGRAYPPAGAYLAPRVRAKFIEDEFDTRQGAY